MLELVGLCLDPPECFFHTKRFCDSAEPRAGRAALPGPGPSALPAASIPMETPTAPGGKGRPERGQRSAGKRRNAASEPGRSGPGSPAGGRWSERPRDSGLRCDKWPQPVRGGPAGLRGAAGPGRDTREGGGDAGSEKTASCWK